MTLKLSSNILWPAVVLVMAMGVLFTKPWQTQNKETVSVTAQGTAKTAPDVAKINATITTQNDNLDIARQQSEKKVSEIITKVQALGIDQKDIKTQNISGNPGYEIMSEPDKPQSLIFPPPQRPNTNEFSTTLEITLRDFTKADELIAALTQNGATNIYGPQLTISDEKLEEAKSQARQNAVESARKKADELADASGADLGKVTKISEMGDFGYPVPLVARSEADLQQKASTIQPGQDQVTISLSVEFELK